MSGSVLEITPAVRAPEGMVVPTGAEHFPVRELQSWGRLRPCGQAACIGSSHCWPQMLSLLLGELVESTGSRLYSSSLKWSRSVLLGMFGCLLGPWAPVVELQLVAATRLAAG